MGLGLGLGVGLGRGQVEDRGQGGPPLPLPLTLSRLARLLWAYAVVESRGMVVSGLQGGNKQRVTALVPVADMLNHRATAQVR